LAEKAAAKYDPRREQEARGYIEQITGESFSSDSFHDSLKDGILLCKLMNKILPSDPIKIGVSKMPFKQMENIGQFLGRLEKMGVPAYDRFQTVDLYEAKNLDQVVNCIFSLSRHAAAKGFDGPVLGPKLATKSERQFTEEQLAKSRSIVPKLASFTSPVGAIETTTATVIDAPTPAPTPVLSAPEPVVAPVVVAPVVEEKVVEQEVVRQKVEIVNESSGYDDYYEEEEEVVIIEEDDDYEKNDIIGSYHREE
ncbi:Muscle-specific protein 20, partial [Blyttiomyces sp. JEL0837]